MACQVCSPRDNHLIAQQTSGHNTPKHKGAATEITIHWAQAASTQLQQNNNTEPLEAAEAAAAAARWELPLRQGRAQRWLRALPAQRVVIRETQHSTPGLHACTDFIAYQLRCTASSSCHAHTAPLRAVAAPLQRLVKPTNVPLEASPTSRSNVTSPTSPTHSSGGPAASVFTLTTTPALQLTPQGAISSNRWRGLVWWQGGGGAAYAWLFAPQAPIAAVALVAGAVALVAAVALEAVASRLCSMSMGGRRRPSMTWTTDCKGCAGGGGGVGGRQERGRGAGCPSAGLACPCSCCGSDQGVTGIWCPQ